MYSVKFKGSEYRTDGKNIWRDGLLLDSKIEPVSSVEKVDCLIIDGRIYYNGNFYVQETYLAKEPPLISGERASLS